MKFEDVVAELGEFGPYQKKMYFLACISIIPLSLQTMVGIFIMGNQEHRCAIPELLNDTYVVHDTWHDDVINRWIPVGDSTQGYSPCQIYVKDNSTGQMTNSTQDCDRYVYDKSVFTDTITSEANMVCDHKSQTTYTNMIFMAGMLVGSLFFGVLSDLIGRKKTMIMCLAGQLISSFSVAFTTTFISFAILRFFSAWFGIGVLLTSFVIGMEIVGPKARRHAGIIIEIFWSFGMCLIVFLAFLIRDWKHLQMTTAAPNAIILALSFLMAESPRWLIQKNRHKEASEILKKAARGNKVTLSSKATDLTQIEQDGPSGKIWQMFTTKILLVRCLILLYFWWVSSLTYFGLTLNVSALSGDVYFNFTLNALAEGLSYVVVLLVLDRTGRIPILTFCMLMAGTACLGTIFPVLYGGDDLSWMTQALSLIGKFGASISFAVAFIYAAEFFPTSIRNSGLGLCSFSARFGGIIAPYIADLGKIVTGKLGVILPLVIFGGAAILAGILILLLPETTNRILPETIQDAKKFGRKSKKRLDNDLCENETFLTNGNSKGDQEPQLLQMKA